jgi:hypothetical protein
MREGPAADGSEARVLPGVRAQSAVADANWTPIGPHGWDLSETEVAILRVNKIKPD